MRVRSIRHEVKWTELLVDEDRTSLGRGVNSGKEMGDVNGRPFHRILQTKRVNDEHSIACKKFRHEVVIFGNSITGLFTVCQRHPMAWCDYNSLSASATWAYQVWI